MAPATAGLQHLSPLIPTIKPPPPPALNPRPTPPPRLVYDADQAGWSYRAFHEGVDDKGAAIVLARSEGGAVFGGYNPEGWIGLGEDRASNGAFLFTFLNGDTTKPAIKLPKVRRGLGTGALTATARLPALTPMPIAII
jgi:hypothetical protein